MKKITKKLSLNKQAISGLEKHEATNDVMGATGYFFCFWDSWGAVSNCANDCNSTPNGYCAPVVGSDAYSPCE